MLCAAGVAEIWLGSASVEAVEIWRSLFTPATADPGALVIVRAFRLPRLVTAVAAGSALALSGLLMQTVFRNPLAGPFVLGVSSGAGLAVALQVLIVGGGATLFAPLLGVSSLFAAILGSAATLFLVLAVGNAISQPATLLILGLLFSYAGNAIVQILSSRAQAESIQRFVAWSYGSFDAPQPAYALALLGMTVVSVAGTYVSGARLDALLLGPRYAETMGVPIRRNRVLLIGAAGILAGTTTALCGPIGFVGITAPHIARAYLRRSDHRAVVIGTVLVGAILATVADLVSHLPGSAGVVPVNAVTALIGVPVVVIVLFRARGVAV